jgi:hypothetical protein
MTWHDVFVWLSGFASGWLVIWYWLAKPMARLLGYEKKDDA